MTDEAQRKLAVWAHGEVRREIAGLAAYAEAAAQPAAQHAGPEAPPGTPSPLPSWSQLPPTYPESVPEKSCRTPEEIWALAKPGEFSTLTAEEFEAFQKYGAPKNYGHVAEKCAWCLDPAAPGKRHCQRCLALAFPDSAATENPVVYVIGPEIPSPAPENQAVLAERERCSKVVREWARGCNNFCTSKVLNQVYGSALNDLAETLRHPEWADATTP